MDAPAVQRAGPVDTRQSPYARLRTLSLRSVSLTGGFWKEKQIVNREATIPQVRQMLERHGGNAIKWLEGVAYEMSNEASQELGQMADQAIEAIVAAQAEDGYYSRRRELVEAPQLRFRDLGWSHELYVAGHLVQAAVAHHRVTGKRKLLDVACRFADYIDSVFGPGKRMDPDGHPEVEMALVELYRDTRDRRYLDLGRFFVDQRGHGLIELRKEYGDSAYFQDHTPVREASTVVGHAVRQLYLNSGVADVYLETGEQALLDALVRQWEYMTSRQLFITGGVGPRYRGEAFGEAYELPNDRCYCETCAQIASIMWSWRMLLATGQGRFADLIEATLYNGFLSGVSLDGRRFFYVNPLMVRGTPFVLAGPGANQRQEWFRVPCCPTNVPRMIASLGHYFATVDPQGLQIHLYNSARIDTELPAGGRVALSMETDYPWDGQVRFAIEAENGSVWRLALRRPGWCKQATVRVNGQLVDPLNVEPGYLTVERQWRTGDVVELSLAMAPRLMEAHPRVDSTRCSVAIERGPIVYCLEQSDQELSVDVRDVEIDETAALQASWDKGLLGGVEVVEAGGCVTDTTPWEGKLYRPLVPEGSISRRPIRLRCIPYYAWANRTPGPMRVWIPRRRVTRQLS